MAAFTILLIRKYKTTIRFAYVQKKLARMYKKCYLKDIFYDEIKLIYIKAIITYCFPASAHGTPGIDAKYAAVNLKFLSIKNHI